ncbi:MAG: transposase [Thermoplasmata archaeon]
MTTRRQWSAEEKLRIVLEGLKPHANIEEISRQHGIHSSQYYTWRERALAGMKGGLESKPDSAEYRAVAEVARMKKLIADLTIANDVLREDLYGRPRGKNAAGGS